MKLLLENWRKYIKEENLYHGTSDVYKQNIAKNGLKPPSFWGTEEVARYYAEEIVAEEGGSPLIIEAPLSKFDQTLLSPDDNSIAEPLTYTLGKTEDEVEDEWGESDGSWRDSLEIVGSVKYHGTLEDII
jgi:hypothetical protein